MDEEVWKTIPISTNYEASSHGRIRNKRTGHVLKQAKTLKGYRRVDIKGTEKENITRFVHRLVAITFIPNPDNKPTVNHKTPDPSNNNVSNLEWHDHKQQSNHARKRKLTSEENPSDDTWGKRKVWKCDQTTGDKLEIFETVRDAACAVTSSLHGMSQIFNVAENHEISTLIPGCRKGRLTAAGYKWQFDELRELSTEEWGDIDLFDARGIEGYQISTLGRLCDPRGNVQSPYAGGYATHSIGGNNTKAHRLVALTFLGRIEGKDYVNHIDGNKNNAVVENLEWCSLSENMKHAHDTGLIVREVKQLLQYDLEGNFLRKFDSVKKAKEEFGSVNIHESIRKSSNAGGYIWKRPTDDEDRVVTLKEPGYNYRKIRQFDMNGIFLRNFDSIREAQKEVPGFTRNAARTRGSAAGYLWNYADDNEPLSKRKGHHSKKKINQYSLDMEYIQQFESTVAARIQVPSANIWWAIKHSKPSKGFRWAYA